MTLGNKIVGVVVVVSPLLLLGLVEVVAVTVGVIIVLLSRAEIWISKPDIHLEVYHAVTDTKTVVKLQGSGFSHDFTLTLKFAHLMVDLIR